MILGIGTDLVDTRRIERAIRRFPDKFPRRIFSKAEIKEAKLRVNSIDYFAKRFAVKEAVYKALSKSELKGFGWQEAETLNKPDGSPYVKLTGQCKSALETMAPDGYNATLSVSLSDEFPFALAFIVISAAPIGWMKPND